MCIKEKGRLIPRQNKQVQSLFHRIELLTHGPSFISRKAIELTDAVQCTQPYPASEFHPVKGNNQNFVKSFDITDDDWHISKLLAAFRLTRW